MSKDEQALHDKFVCMAIYLRLSKKDRMQAVRFLKFLLKEQENG